MAIFYTDSGSFNNLEVTGSTILSGSLIVSGATNFGPSGLTGSLFGTASVADSASFVEYTSIANKPTLLSSSAFTSPSQGTVRITINGVETDVDTGLQTGDTPSFAALLVDTDGLVVDAGLDRVGIGTTVPTARLTVNGNTHISGTFTTTGDVHYLGRNMPGGSEVGLRLGVGRVANGFGYIDLVTDTTYTDYGLRIIRDNTGPNAPSKFLHRGTGNIEYYSQEPADVVWITDNAGRMIIKGLGGFVGLNKTNPTARLDILGDQIISGSLIVSASQAITASNVQLNNLTDTTSANKVLVLDTTTNKIFTTASVGGGSSTPAFPFNGSAIITGSLLVSSSVANPVTITGSINDFFELEIVNANAGNAASADIVASNDLTTDVGNYIDMGINSSTYAGALVGGPSDGYLYFTSSVGELHVGNASTGATSNVRLFAGGPSSDNTTRMFISGSGNIGIGTTTNLLNKLTVQGSISASSVTGSLTGSFTGSLAHFNPVTLKLTVGTTAPSSPAVNDLWVDTN